MIDALAGLMKPLDSTDNQLVMVHITHLNRNLSTDGIIRTDMTQE